MTTWVNPTYYGIVEAPTVHLPDATEILSGDTLHQVTSNSVTVPLTTTAAEWGWIAVHAGQTGGDYATWWIDALNNSAIGSSHFIEKKGVVTVNGAPHDVYTYTYPSEVDSSANITLNK